MFNHIIGDGILLVPQKRVVIAVNNAFSPFGWSQPRSLFKGNVFQEIINNPVTIVTEPFKALDREVIQPLYREVIQPVGHALEKIGQGIAKDPVTFIAQAAAIAAAPFTAGQSLWALPVIAAASTAAKGGSWEQILTNTAIAAATAAVGGGFGMENSVGGLISSGMQTGGSVAAGTATYSIAGMSISASTASAIAAAGQGIAMGAVQATGAAVQGKDPFQAALPSLVGSALGFAGNQLAQAEFFAPITETLSKVSDTVGPIVSKAMTGVASAAITGAVTGKDMTQVAIASLANTAISGIVSATNVVADFFKDDYGNITKFGTATQSIVADLLGSVAATVASGGKLGAPMGAQFLTNTTKTLTPFLTEGFNSLAEEVKSMYIGAESKVIALNNAAIAQQGLVDKYNSDADKVNKLADDVNSLLTKRDEVFKAYNAATTQSEVDRLKAEFNSLESQITTKTAEYNALYDTLDDTNAAYLESVKTTEAAQKDYFEASKALGAKGTELSGKMNEMSAAVVSNLAKDIDPNFNAEEYKTINNLGPGIDPYTHFLSAGKDQGLATNFDAMQAPKEQQMTILMEGIAKLTGRELASYDSNEIADLRDKLESKFGNNLWAMQNTTADKIVKESGLAASDWLDPGGPKSTQASDWFYKTYGGTLPFGTRQATQTEVASGKASLMYLDGGQPVWLASNGKSASVIFNNESGTVVKNVTLSTYSYTDSDGERHIIDKPITVGDYVNINTGKVISPSPYEVLVMPKADGWVSVESIADDGQVQRVPLDDLGGLETLYTYGGMDKSAAALVVDLGGVAKQETINAAKAVIDAAQSTGNSTLINTAANVVKAGGGFLTAIGGIATMLGQAPKDSDLGKQLEALGKASNTQEYQDKINAINSMVGNAKGVGGTLDAIWKGFKSAPAEFLAEYIGVEGFQEIAPLLIGGGVGTYARGLAIAKGLGEAAAGQIGASVGLRAAMVSDLAESIGGQATSSYETTYKLAIQKGMNEAAAANYALDVAQKSGLFAGVMTAGSFGIGGMALEKALIPSGASAGMLGNAIEQLWDFSKAGTKITIKEGVTEGGEEGLTQFFLETQLYKLDPTRDVAASVTAATSFGFLAGAPIAGGTFSAANGSDILNAAFTIGNEQFTKQLQSGNYTMGELSTVLNNWLPNTAASQGIRNVLVPSILESVPQYAAQYSNAGDFISAVKSATGVSDDAVLANMAERVDNGKFASQITSTDEAMQILGAQGLTNASYNDAVKAGIVGVTKSDQTQLAQQYSNAQMVSEQELRAAASQENYELTATELEKLVGRGVQADVIAKFIAEVDPKAVTTAEATQYFLDQGYTKARAEDIAQFVKSAPEDSMKTAVAEWVNPRQVTRAEALQFFSQIGYTPSEAEITQFVVQGPEVFQDAIKTQLGEYVDPRFVDAAEVREAFKTMGLNAPVAASDIARLSGQYSEAELAGKAEEALPIVSANAVYALMAGEPSIVQSVKEEILSKIEGYQNLGMAGDIANKAAIDAVAAQLGTSSGNLLNAIGATEQNLLVKISNTEETLLSKINEYKAQGLTQQAATQKALDEMSANLGTTKEDLLSKIGATEENLYTQISGVRQELLDKITLYQQQGLTQQAATQKALDEMSANLGTTRESLLSQIGATEANLMNKLGEYQAQTEERFVGIESNIAASKQSILNQMAAYEQAGMDRDTALDLAISGVAQDLGTTKADLIGQMGTTEANLKAELAGAKSELAGQIGEVQQQVGRPQQQATADDVTTIQGIIAGTTPVNLAYDTNNDGKVDQADLTAVQSQLTFQQNQNIQQKVDSNTGLTYYIDTTTGQEVSPPSVLGGQWAPTGVYAALMQQEARQAEVAKAQAAQAKQAQQKNQFGQLMNMLFQAPDAAGQQVTVKTPDPSKIGYIYDWSSIFATPSQASLMPSPYGAMNTVAPQQQKQQGQPLFSFGFAEGGIVGGSDMEVGGSTNVDDLINILKGNG